MVRTSWHDITHLFTVIKQRAACWGHFFLQLSQKCRFFQGLNTVNNEKIKQMSAYISAVSEQMLHYTELDQFILDTMEEWASLKVTDETPSTAQERVFWHLIHELNLHGSQALQQNLFFKSENDPNGCNN